MGGNFFDPVNPNENCHAAFLNFRTVDKPNHGREDTSVRDMKKRLFFNND